MDAARLQPTHKCRQLARRSLFEPRLERAACGVGFIVNVDGRPSRKLLDDAATMARRMAHRGACSCDNLTGDGAGVMLAMPDAFYRARLAELAVELPPAGHYATGLVFLDPADAGARARAQTLFGELAGELQLRVLAWRPVPHDAACLGQVARDSQPHITQVFVAAAQPPPDGPQTAPRSPEQPAEQLTVAQRAFLLRKRATHRLAAQSVRFYACSLSTGTVVYKGQFTPGQLWQFYADLAAPELASHLALVHARFSTNTLPSWERAHPMRLLAHNGEINTLRGNVNLMGAREGAMRSRKLAGHLQSLYPVIEADQSDSGSLDNVLEFHVEAGERSLAEAALCLLPQAWQQDSLMGARQRAFYQWAACSGEPWDGPALVTFSDGRFVGALLDRNGLRPARYYHLSDGRLALASEVGVLDVEPSLVLARGRLRPGQMLLVDTREARVLDEAGLLQLVLRDRPFEQWTSRLFSLADLVAAQQRPDGAPAGAQPQADPDPNNNDHDDHDHDRDDDKQLEAATADDPRLALFGYTPEVLSLLLLPMAQSGKEALGSMGNDAPLACLSGCQPLVYDYFKQLFAQITNPPIDPFREQVVMSLACPLGPERNVLEASADQCERLWLEQPILSLAELAALKATRFRGWRAHQLDCTWPAAEGPAGLEPALEAICAQACRAARAGASLLVLSDRRAGARRAPVSAPLALGAVHHRLIEERLRMGVALLVETGEAREVHHACVLLGYGADAICPYLVWETLEALRREGRLGGAAEAARAAYVAAMARGLSKVMAKMGISTLQSYKGAQIFEAVGLGPDVVRRCFRGTVSRVGGADLRLLAAETLARHARAFGPAARQPDGRLLAEPGFYHWRPGGEAHINEPAAIAALQAAARQNSRAHFRQFSDATLAQVRKCTLRGQTELVYAARPLPLDQVEPASAIVRRFCTGAMSLGSISLEAHETLAVAMNRLGGRSNTGEGGEDAARWAPGQPAASNRRSAIKQVASGRFGVTAAYLANADELQIKIAQGAKPGEGGELPGHKVSAEIARTRHSTPGVGLISPPPHHDIYSIEDIAELIYDLKAANPSARVSVKLVSEFGVGIVAAGLAKGKAEHIVISGHDGGTGASSWTGIKSAGLPWELGLAESHQVLVANSLRSRVVLQCDGQLRTAFDVLVAAALGADEFGFSTAPLIALGCVMMRKCHLNTCPVGIATQDPELRRKFRGQPEHVVNYLFLLAEDVRAELARLGLRSLQQLVGRADLLRAAPDPRNPKAALLDLAAVLCPARALNPAAEPQLAGSVRQDFQLERRLDARLVAAARPLLQPAAAAAPGPPLSLQLAIANTDRAFGSTLAYEIARTFGEAGLGAPDRLQVQLTGTAGQSFCAFLPAGVTVRLEGDANDYVAKGLSGAKVVVRPPQAAHPDFRPERNVIVGNVCLYGATSGKALFGGLAAERFCVRNSGATAVVEGVGDHGCEYMTGGLVLVLGPTGRNFAAGMSGGLAFVWNEGNLLQARCNPETVDLLLVTDEADFRLLRDLLEEFERETGSQRARQLLADWPNQRRHFTKVFPKEYQRALRQLAAQPPAASGPPAAPEPAAPEPAAPEPAADQQVVDIEELAAAKPDGHDEHRHDEPLDKLRGFVKYQRIKTYYRPAQQRLADWGEIFDQPAIRAQVRVQATRCMDCGVPLCQTSFGCPLGNLVPRWNELVHQQDWRQALEQLLQTNNFPEFTGRVCPAPCEGACVLGINEQPVAIKTVELSIVELAFERGWIRAQPPASRSGRRVAVVGSGPAGLACAAQLNKAGHWVTVFERNDRAGGLLQYGIPSMKLSKAVVERRLELLRAEGVDLRTGQDVGRALDVRHLYRDYDALCLATGATWPRDLAIPGRQLGGVHFAMAFLETWQKQQAAAAAPAPTISAAGKRVLVIGGGDTGCDCIATALRQGARSIVALEIMARPPAARAPDNPWPEWPRVLRTDYGYEEAAAAASGAGQPPADPRLFGVSSKSFADDGQGNVAGVHTVRVQWLPGPDGRPAPSELPGTDQFIACDLVLIAMGFLGSENYLAEQLGAKLDARSNFEARPGSYQSSSHERLFLAGDCRRGQSLVVHAINEGRQAARAIDALFNDGLSSLAGPGGLVQAGQLAAANAKQPAC